MLLPAGVILCRMNRDTVSVVGMAGSVLLLLAFPHPVWFLALFGSFCYGGWRLGQRIIPPEGNTV